MARQEKSRFIFAHNQGCDLIGLRDERRIAASDSRLYKSVACSDTSLVVNSFVNVVHQRTNEQHVYPPCCLRLAFSYAHSASIILFHSIFTFFEPIFCSFVRCVCCKLHRIETCIDPTCPSYLVHLGTHGYTPVETTDTDP